MAIQADGKIVAVGGVRIQRHPAPTSRSPATTQRLARLELLRRRQADDRLQGGCCDQASGLALQGDGKIVAVGGTDEGPGDEFALARYNPQGSLDPSFSGDGKQMTDFGAVGVAYGVALQGDGKIVAVGGGLGTDGTDDFTLARYLGG